MRRGRPIARWTVQPDEDGRTLEDFLRGRVPSEPPERVRQAISLRVRVSWAASVDASTTVPAGGCVVLDPEPLDEIPVDDPISVLAEGDGWIAVEKPSGVPVHPVRSVRRNSVIERLRRQHDDRGLRLAHRLDRETSGVLLLARDGRVASRLGRAFEAGAVRKEYVAVVRGVPDERKGRVELPVGRATDSLVRVRMATGPSGKPARTDWEVEAAGADRALLRLRPSTGRRHQIRVHLEAIGHPVLGDVLYGRPDGDYLDLAERGVDPRLRDGAPRRLLLHACRLELDWPGLRFDIFSAVPRSFEVLAP